MWPRGSWCRREDVNIVIVMRAMGVESDEEVLQLVGTEGPFASLLTPTLQHCKEEGVYTRQQALDYLAGKVKGSGRPASPAGGGGFTRRTRSRVDEARDILANVVLCHVPVVQFDYQQKVWHCPGTVCVWLMERALFCCLPASPLALL